MSASRIAAIGPSAARPSPADQQQSVAANLIPPSRQPGPADARARLVRIAPRGLAAVEVARRAEAEVEAEWTRHLGRQATAGLRRALSRLREITDPYQ